jgi:transcriptional regulator with XRE-family HTH domain
MNGPKAEFRILRELVGASQELVAAELGVDKRTIKRWESPATDWEPRQFAWDWLEEARMRQLDVVASALEAADLQPDAPVALTYWANAAEYEAAHPRQGGYWSMANANARLVYDALTCMGREVTMDARPLRELLGDDELPDGY